MTKSKRREMQRIFSTGSHGFHRCCRFAHSHIHKSQIPRFQIAPCQKIPSPSKLLQPPLWNPSQADHVSTISAAPPITFPPTPEPFPQLLHPPTKNGTPKSARSLSLSSSRVSILSPDDGPAAPNSLSSWPKKETKRHKTKETKKREQWSQSFFLISRPCQPPQTGTSLSRPPMLKTLLLVSPSPRLPIRHRHHEAILF